jgi:hypothetical protein
VCHLTLLLLVGLWKSLLLTCRRHCCCCCCALLLILQPHQLCWRQLQRWQRWQQKTICAAEHRQQQPRQL